MLLLVLLRLLALAEAGGPAGKAPFLAASDGQFVGGDILGNNRAGADDRARADADRGYQRRVGADESPRTDFGPVLSVTIIIAGDRAGADVGPLADRSVADIGKMIGLGALAQLGLLHLNEIA